MELLLRLLYGVVGSVLLYYGADALIKGGVSIARRMKISPLVIGLTLVALGTSAPELVVSVDSALQGAGDISLGNVIGSNICNIGLILGISSLISTLTVHKKLLALDVPLLVVASVVLLIFYWLNQGVSRIQGALLFVCMISYTLYSIRAGRKETKEPPEGNGSELNPPYSVWKSLVFVAVGLAGLVFGAKLFVGTAMYIARLMSISEAVIGLTVVAVGTSLPELATSIVAAFKGEKDIAVGNVVGSNLLNILCILGIVPLISPIHAPDISIIDIGLMVVLSIALYVMMCTGRVISRLEGGILTCVYVSYVAWLVYQA